MANKIILKKTSTASKVPLPSDLEVGEIAVNLADQKLYSKNASGTVILVGDGQGTGDVVGPSSATDNALARFDTTTGKLIQNSVITQDDNGTLANVNAITLDTTPTSAPTSQGTMFWDSGNGTPSIILDADVSLQLGQEMLALVYNGSGSTITNGSVVAVNGAQGQRPSVVLADADSESLSAPTLGIATEDIANGAEGFVTTFGFVRGLNTSAFTAGLPIYLSQTAGQFTQTRPSAPAHTVALGWVIKVNASSGEVFVNINNGWELDELHNVLITSPTSGQQLIYNDTTGVWENSNSPIINGGSITVADNSFTLQDETDPTKKAIFQLSGITTGTTRTYTLTNASGTIPLTNASQTWSGTNTFSGATVTVGTSTATSTYGVGTGATISGSTKTVNIGTAGVSGSTTNLNIGSAVSGATTNANAYGTWIFNTPLANTNLANSSITINGSAISLGGSTSVGTVTSVSGTAPISVATGTTTPAISISQASSTTNGYLSSTDWNTFNNKGSGTVTSITAGTGLTGGTITTSGTVALATSGVTANTYGSSTAIPVITFDTYGRATSVTTATVAGGQYFGSATVKAIAYNSNTIAENVTVTSGNNGYTASPLTINSGYTVTVESGANWIIF